MKAFLSCGLAKSALALMLLAAGCATAPAPGKSAAAPTKPAAPVFLQADVLAQDAKALDEKFGAAALVRREGQGEFRRYTLAKCELIVILYPDEAGRVAVRRLDAAAKSSGAPAPDLDECLAAGLAAG